ncbi:TlpA family protein disulfide reductase [Salsuginibacillus kocurii]|uniref:TlpA family protein disulfide reductase n=1 Tax=Salsuginibacillus kocurii TaxID=427078 RepID=UPI0003808A4D|nr:TlpA disulfide reductase family protein [Salsuginibacillus kocurii]
MLPEIELKEPITNATQSLEKYGGRPLMLTFWTSWCPDARQDWENKKKVVSRLEAAGLNVVMINVTGREPDQEKLEAFINEEKESFKILLDDGTTLYDYYRCKGVPTTILFNPEGEVVHQYDDTASFVEIMEGLTELIDPDA